MLERPEVEGESSEKGFRKSDKSMEKKGYFARLRESHKSNSTLFVRNSTCVALESPERLCDSVFALITALSLLNLLSQRCHYMVYIVSHGALVTLFGIFVGNLQKIATQTKMLTAYSLLVPFTQNSATITRKRIRSMAIAKNLPQN